MRHFWHLHEEFQQEICWIPSRRSRILDPSKKQRACSKFRVNKGDVHSRADVWHDRNDQEWLDPMGYANSKGMIREKLLLHGMTLFLTIIVVTSDGKSTSMDGDAKSVCGFTT